MLLEKWNVMVLCAVTTLLASCQTPGGGDCQVFGPIVANSQDTRGTLNQIATHNAKGVRVCGWKPPGN